MRPLPSPCAWFSSYARLSLPEHACLSAIEPRLPYLNGGPLKKKRPARRGLAGHGGDSEAALVRGNRLRVMGMRLTGGDWPFGVASFRGYAIDCQRSISFVV